MRPRVCVVCFEDVVSADTATWTPCIHVFHTDCIKPWIATKLHSDTIPCPTCKYDISQLRFSFAEFRNDRRSSHSMRMLRGYDDLPLASRAASVVMTSNGLVAARVQMFDADNVVPPGFGGQDMDLTSDNALRMLEHVEEMMRLASRNNIIGVAEPPSDAFPEPVHANDPRREADLRDAMRGLFDEVSAMPHIDITQSEAMQQLRRANVIRFTMGNDGDSDIDSDEENLPTAAEIEQFLISGDEADIDSDGDISPASGASPLPRSLPGSPLFISPASSVTSVSSLEDTPPAFRRGVSFDSLSSASSFSSDPAAADNDRFPPINLSDDPGDVLSDYFDACMEESAD